MTRREGVSREAVNADHVNGLDPTAARLRALYVVHKLPASLAGGWSLRSVANLAALATFADVDVVAIRQWANQDDAPELDASARTLLSQYASDLQFVDPLMSSESRRSRTRRVLRDGLLMSAVAVHPEMAHAVGEAWRTHELVWLEGTYTAQYAPLIEGRALTLLDTHNVESQLERGYTVQTRRPGDFLRSCMRLMSIRRAERRYLRHVVP